VIPNITKGRRAGGALRYDFGPGRKDEHVDARFITGNVPGTRQQVARQIDHHIRQGDDIKKPLWRCSLSLPPEDGVLPDEQWARIAESFIERMGFEACPWVAVRHGEDHIHLTVSRLAWDGTLASDRWDWPRARAICDGLEEEHGLVRARDRFREAGPGVRSGAELAASQRRGAQVPERLQLRELVRAARDASAGRGRAGFEAALTKAGVEYHAHVASTGRMNGYRFAMPGWTNEAGDQIWVKASDIGKDMGWAKLRPVLDTVSTPPTAKPPRPGDHPPLPPRPPLPKKDERQEEELPADPAAQLLAAFRAMAEGQDPADVELPEVPRLPTRLDKRKHGLLTATELGQHLTAVKDIVTKRERALDVADTALDRLHQVAVGEAPGTAFKALAQDRRQLEEAAEHREEAKRQGELLDTATTAMTAARAEHDTATTQAKKSKWALIPFGTTPAKQQKLADEAKTRAEQAARAASAARAAKTRAEQSATKAAGQFYDPEKALSDMVKAWPELSDAARAADMVDAAGAIDGQDQVVAAARDSLARSQLAVHQVEEELALRETFPPRITEAEDRARREIAAARRAAAARGKSTTSRGKPGKSPTINPAQPRPGQQPGRRRPDVPGR